MIHSGGLGDLARYFSSSMTNGKIRSELNRLTKELSTGRVSDLAKSLTTQVDRVPDVSRRLGIARNAEKISQMIGGQLGLVQLSLDAVDGRRLGLYETISVMSQSSGNAWHSEAADQAATTFEDMIAALNTRYAGKALFAGTAEDVSPFADPGTILTDIRATVAGLTTAADVVAALDTWFDAAGGGFETVAYLGDDGDLASRRIDPLTQISFDARGDDPGIREVLKGVALTALADDAGLAMSDAERDALVDLGAASLLASSSAFVDLQARVGADEARAEEARARLTAEVLSLEIIYNSLVAADPFETATELEQMQIQMETHYAVTARLSQLTLTRYL